MKKARNRNKKWDQWERDQLLYLVNEARDNPNILWWGSTSKLLDAINSRNKVIPPCDSSERHT